MRKTLLYIIGIAAMVLTSCTDDVAEKADFLNGSEKTPLTVSALLDKSSSATTRAVNKEFEQNDQLIAYLRHVTWNGNADGARTNVSADQAPLLVTFTKGSTAMTAYDGSDITPIGTGVALGLTSSNTQQTADLTASPKLYWDDFSNSVDAAHDLRSANHYLESYYGYCYNGGTPTTSLVPADGTLGWTVATNQSTGFKTSDLLWSYEQTPVAYTHAAGRDGLVIPYTHAMSKVTIEVVCRDGFNADVANFSGASVVLKNMNTVASLTAPTGVSVAVPGADDVNVKDITTQPTAHATTPNTCYSFAALIAPTTMKDGQILAKINNVDGNDYTLTLTKEALDTEAANDWASKLTSYASATGGTTQPGVNYLITVTINKQEITVEANIKDWDEVSAEGIGQILFDNDVTDKIGDIADALKTNGFDLYKSTNTTFGTKATTVSWNSTEWTYTPKIYWQNKDDKEYFRALSGAIADDPATNDDNESLAMSQGRDVLWGTTAAHTGTDVNGNAYNYAKSAQIDPRTGNVPLEFEHAMSKISVNLLSSGDNAVNLSDATVSIINTYNEGKIDINTGDISEFDLNLTSPAVYTLNETVNGEYKLLDKIVIPQSLVNDKDGNTRGTTPTFYQSAELTKIYNDGTSLPAGGGEGTYYLTSTLDPVNYEAGELTEIYADGTSIDDAGSAETYVTSTLNLVAAQAAIKYTEAEADEENAKHLIADSEGHLPNDDGYNTTYEPGYTPVTIETDRIPAVPEHYAINANSKKATTSTFKCYKTNGSSEQHTPGELKSAGNKIMMYITLTDGTRYSLELSKCKVKDTETLVEKWMRGEHYTYEITLGKEEIIFRAIVKDWVEKTGSGNATLDWD